MNSIDLNSDVGEGCPNDRELMEYVSSVNIACGSHAGDAEIMRATVDIALENNVAIGAHPSYPDRQNFGRIHMDLDSGELFSVITEQILLLRSVCDAAGAKITHVKPHGALYNTSARDPAIAALVAAAVSAVDPNLILYGLSGSFSITEAKQARIQTASEAFADRTYQPDGSLTPRSQLGALIDVPSIAASQALSLALDNIVQCPNGVEVQIFAETICIHGDGPNAVEIARSVYDSLFKNNIKIQNLYV